MRNKNIDQIVLNSIKQVAPEATLESLQAELPFRDQFEFDSVDFLNSSSSCRKKRAARSRSWIFPSSPVCRGVGIISAPVRELERSLYNCLILFVIVVVVVIEGMLPCSHGIGGEPSR